MGEKIFVPFPRDLYLELARKIKSRRPEEIIEVLCNKYLEKLSKTKVKKNEEEETRENDDLGSILSSDIEFLSYLKKEGIPDNI